MKSQMKTLALLSLALCCLPGLALAEAPSCAKSLIAELDGISVEDVRITDATVDPLYVALAGAQSGDVVEVEILVDGVRHLGESLTLGTALAIDAERGLQGPQVVELLAAHPQRLARLDRFAASRDIAVHLRHAGAEVVYAFDALRVDAASLDAQGARPFDLTSTLHLAAQSTPTKNACIDFCDMEYEDCIFYRCEPEGSQSCYNACEAQFVDCLEFECSICQVETSTSTNDTLHQVNPTGIQECRWSTFYGVGYYDYLQLVIKRTTTTTTTNADCSETVTTSVSYYNSYCWRLAFNNPFCNPFFQAIPLC
ncbi:MAG: hypothetical protein AAGC60_20950 [Acidobacteriota bacterium]